MAREQSFLERLANISHERFGGPTVAEDVEALAESVRLNLARLLNARHGMSEAAPDYGLPVLGELMADRADSVAIVREAVQNTISKYEPRLRRVRVTPVCDESDLRGQTLVLRIDAVLVGRSGEHQVWYMTSVKGSGEFDVTG